MSLTKANDETFEKDIMDTDQLVLVDFGATWCGPCKALEPVLDELASEYAGKVRIVRCDIEEAPQTAQKYGVLSVPTVLFLKNGKEIDRFVGAERKDKIATKIEDKLNSA